MVLRKKCPPNNFCMEHLNMILLLLILGFLVYLYHIYLYSMPSLRTPYSVGIDPNTYLIPRPSGTITDTGTGMYPALGGISTRMDVLNDPYIPPVKVDGYVFDRYSNDIRGMPPMIASIQQNPLVPVNVETRGIRNEYSQMGILTKTDSSENNTTLILPLMGRRTMNGRDKWQYYSISNTGNLNTKLPVRIQGKSCTSEYGCDPVMSGDIVYVEGYNHSFKATIYENGLFSYIPVL
jgi:hypothetical protein